MVLDEASFGAGRHDSRAITRLCRSTVPMCRGGHLEEDPISTIPLGRTPRTLTALAAGIIGFGGVQGPIQSATLTFADVSAGGFHTCGVTTSGTAYCWGSNAYGQLGDGTRTDRSKPVAVAGGIRFAAVSAGKYYTCGVSTAGAAYCWGSNLYGVLGDGTEIDRLEPARVAGGISFAAVSAGGFGHTCGVTHAGAAYCWGHNNAGQLGDGTTADRLNPVAVLGSQRYAAISVGETHTCGATAAGAAYCWGNGFGGQLGDGTTDERSSPVRVGGGVRYVAVTAGDFHTCAVSAGGAVYCWGTNNYGLVGDGTTIDRLTPVRVAGRVSYAAVSAGSIHTCAVTAAGAAYCWGLNHGGQLGDGTTLDRHSPVRVVAGVRFAKVRVGRNGMEFVRLHTCGITAAGAAYCWGWNERGQLGDGTTIDRYTPVRVAR